MMKLFMSVIGLVMLSSAAIAQSALELDSDQPIEITADSLEVLQESNQAIFVGAVEALQGNITLRADSMIVTYRAASAKESSAAGLGGVSRIAVKGNVKLATPEESADAQQGMYDVGKKTITLRGNVLLKRGQNMLRGQQLVYNLKTQKSLLTSGGMKAPDGSKAPTGGRVKGIFVPNQK